MKALIEKQLVQWKEELAVQIKKRDNANRVLTEANRAILMIEGGIQGKEMLLREIEKQSQPKDKEVQDPQSKKEPSK